MVVSSFLACKKGKWNKNACNGDTRREVKIMIDEKASLVNMTPISTTIIELGKLTVPEVKSETGRQSVELQVYTVRAKVDKVDKKWDGDYHIRLVDEENYLIAECPNPGCEYASESSLNSKYKEVLEFIKNNDLEGKYVTLTGVAFIDIDHHYKRKQAPNNLELHPIVSISF